jgi:cysteine desulfurase
LHLTASTIDYAPISGHKVYAPKGIGLLYVREGAPLVPLLAGGGQEGGARGGTENLPGVAAIGAVLQCLLRGDDGGFKAHSTLCSFRDCIVASLTRAFPSIQFNTPFEHAVPTTINFSVRGLASKELLDLFDAAGIRVSSGSACGSALKGSYVLEAMGLPKWQCDGAIRLSFGPMIDEAEVAIACERIEQAGAAMMENCLMARQDATSPKQTQLDGLVQFKDGSNCSWLLLDRASKTCVVIDPFEELSERIQSVVSCQANRLLAILDTHQHVDHQSCRPSLLRALTPLTDAQAQTRDVLGWPELPTGQVLLDDGSMAPYFQFSSTLIIAQTDLPGHTVDGRAFLVGVPTDDGRLPASQIRFAFTGDTLLIGGIGRTDFHSSSTQSLFESLRRLPKIISPRTLICPTHDYNLGFATTLESEVRNNAFLAEIVGVVQPMTLEQFATRKAQMDSQIVSNPCGELICGLIQTHQAGASSVDIQPEELNSFFARHRDALIIDVREPHEYAFAQSWATLGLTQSPINIPLTRLSNFLPTLFDLIAESPHRDIIFVCRSGNRSSKAAEVVRRLGIRNAWHIAGGIALGGIRREQMAEAEEEEVEYMI